MLAFGYAYWAALLAAAHLLHSGSTTEVVTDFDGRRHTIVLVGQSLDQVNPGPVRVILGGCLVCLVVACVSVAWRVARQVTRVGVTALVATSLVGFAVVLGALTVGLYLAPLGAVLAVAALPMDRLVPSGATRDA